MMLENMVLHYRTMTAVTHARIYKCIDNWRVTVTIAKRMGTSCIYVSNNKVLAWSANTYAAIHVSTMM